MNEHFFHRKRSSRAFSAKYVWIPDLRSAAPRLSGMTGAEFCAALQNRKTGDPFEPPAFCKRFV
jgi:hypothetical protein